MQQRRSVAFWNLKKTTLWKPVGFWKYFLLAIISYVAFGVFIGIYSPNLSVSTSLGAFGLINDIIGAIWLVRPLLKGNDIIDQLADTEGHWFSNLNHGQIKVMREDKALATMGVLFLIFGFGMQLAAYILSDPKFT